MLLNLLGLGKIWFALCGKLSAEGTTASHRQLGQNRADALLQRMDVPGLAWAVFLGDQGEYPCIAVPCVVSLLNNRDFISLEFSFFLLREYQNFRSADTFFTLLPLKPQSLLPLRSVGGELGPYWALLKTPLFNNVDDYVLKALQRRWNLKSTDENKWSAAVACLTCYFIPRW